MPWWVWRTASRVARAGLARRALSSCAVLAALAGVECAIAGDVVTGAQTAWVASWALAPYAPSFTTWLLAGAHAVATGPDHALATVVTWVLAALVRAPTPPRVLELVGDGDPDRDRIYRARHEVYAEELGQYEPNDRGALTDPTDAYNVYVAARRGDELEGFVAITPPGRRKAMERLGVRPLRADSHELRLLTVLRGTRGRGVSRALMYAAARYAMASGGSSVEAMARVEVLPLYLSIGARPASAELHRVGAVEYVHVVVEELRLAPPADVLWDLPCLPEAPAACVHGGRGLETLDPQGVHADVLDAWFEPAPAVLHALRQPADVRTTPPARAETLVNAIAASRGIDPRGVVLGAGSSDLIYRCFFAWLTPRSRVLLLDPTYAEYAHVLDTIGCRVTRLALDPARDFRLDPADVPPGDFDLAVLVNPNNPTGVLCPSAPDIVECLGPDTLVWVDETYMDYAGREHSLCKAAQARPNLVVCTSLSKSHALSGLRVAYLCAHPATLEAIRARTPPWQVGRLAQRAAVAALENEAYYAARREDTAVLRRAMEAWLRARGWRVVPGACANFVMCRPPPGLDARAAVEACAADKVYLRLVHAAGEDWVRIAVRHAEDAVKVREALGALSPAPACCASTPRT